MRIAARPLSYHSSLQEKASQYLYEYPNYSKLPKKITYLHAFDEFDSNTPLPDDPNRPIRETIYKIQDVLFDESKNPLDYLDIILAFLEDKKPYKTTIIGDLINDAMNVPYNPNLPQFKKLLRILQIQEILPLDFATIKNTIHIIQTEPHINGAILGKSNQFTSLALDYILEDDAEMFEKFISKANVFSTTVYYDSRTYSFADVCLLKKSFRCLKVFIENGQKLTLKSSIAALCRCSYETLVELNLDQDIDKSFFKYAIKWRRFWVFQSPLWEAYPKKKQIYKMISQMRVFVPNLPNCRCGIYSFLCPRIPSNYDLYSSICDVLFDEDSKDTEIADVVKDLDPLITYKLFTIASHLRPHKYHQLLDVFIKLPQASIVNTIYASTFFDYGLLKNGLRMKITNKIALSDIRSVPYLEKEWALEVLKEYSEDITILANNSYQLIKDIAEPGYSFTLKFSVFNDDLEGFINNKPNLDNSFYFRFAAANGSLLISNFLLWNGEDDANINYPIIGNLVSLVHILFKGKKLSTCISTAAKYRRLNILNWLKDNFDLSGDILMGLYSYVPKSVISRIKLGKTFYYKIDISTEAFAVMDEILDGMKDKVLKGKEESIIKDGKRKNTDSLRRELLKRPVTLPQFNIPDTLGNLEVVEVDE